MSKIFSIKTLYRTTAKKKPKQTDKNYREDIDLIEERIVTLKARNFNDAITKGEKEAKEYASQTEYINPYGQKMKQKYIGSIDVFEPFDKIKANTEVFSTTYLIKTSVSNDKLTNNMMGKIYKNEKKIRTKFFNIEFSGKLNPKGNQ